jgi:hypothetical protein
MCGSNIRLEIELINVNIVNNRIRIPIFIFIVTEALNHLRGSGGALGLISMFRNINWVENFICEP